MVQTIATLIDETLMVMDAHLHVRMTDEEKAYLDAHFELIHIKKGEHLVTRGEEVCYLYYLESGIVRLWNTSLGSSASRITCSVWLPFR